MTAEHLFRQLAYLSYDCEIVISYDLSKGCKCGKCTDVLVSAVQRDWKNNSVTEVELVRWSYDVTDEHQQKEMERVLKVLSELTQDKVQAMLEEKAKHG